MLSDCPTRRALITGSLAAAGLGGCDRIFARKTGEYGFRIVLGLVVEGRPVTVEAVRKVVSWEHHGWVPTANRSYENLFGDAASIAIGDLTLFLTRGGYQQFRDGPVEPTGLWTPYTVYRRRDIANPPDWTEPQTGLSMELSPEDLPVLVTAMGSDPASVQIVTPEVLPDRLPGVRLGRSWVEWTRRPPTRSDVRRRLPWAYDEGRKPQIYPHVDADRHLFGL